MKYLLVILLVLSFILPSNGLADSTRTLAVAGYIDYSLHTQFVTSHPEITITLSDNYYRDTNRLIDALLTHDATYDVIFISTQAIDARALIGKGYTYSLTQSNILKQSVEDMYPDIRQWAEIDNQIYALPIGLTCREMIYRPEFFSDLGLSVPCSWEDVAALINSWPEQSDEVRETYNISQWTYEYRSWFLQNMMGNYVAYCKACGLKLHFDTPVFRRLMTLADDITNANDVNISDDAAIAAIDDMLSLFENGIDPLQNGYRSSRPFPSIAIDGKVYHGVYITLGIINPYSEHANEAIAYLEYLAQNVSPQIRLTLYPNDNTPVENTDFVEAEAQWKAEQARLNDAIAASSPENKYELQEELENYNASWKWIERTRYDVSSEDIAGYTALEDELVYLGPSLLITVDSSGQMVLKSPQKQYLDGNLTSEQFINEIENKARMIQLEGE